MFGFTVKIIDLITLFFVISAVHKLFLLELDLGNTLLMNFVSFLSFNHLLFLQALRTSQMSIWLAYLVQFFMTLDLFSKPGVR